MKPDPVKLKHLLDLLETAEQARTAGLPQAEIDMEIYERSDGEAHNISTLREAIAKHDKPYTGVKGFARAVGEGASLSFADELAGGLAWLIPGGKGYREARDESRGRYGAYREQHPKLALGGEFLGGALLPAVGGGVGAARAAGAGLGARVVGGILGGATGGVVAGGLTGAGMAPEMRDVPKSTAIGAATGMIGGAAIGAGLPIVGTALKAGAQRVGAMVAPEATAQWLSRDMLRRAMQDAGIRNADELAARAADLPHGSVVADVDPALSRQARTTLNRTGALQREGGPMNALEARHAQRGERIASDLAETAQVEVSYERAVQNLRDEIAVIRREGYDLIEARFPNGFVSDDVANAIENNPELQKFAQEVLPGFGERRPSFREMQDLLIDVRGAAERAVEEKLPGKARRLREAYDALNAAMDRAIPAQEGQPGFAEVQARMAAAYEKMGAYELGARKGINLRAREIREVMQGLSPDGQDAFRVGMVDALETQLRKTATGGASASQLMRAGPEVMERLRPLFADDAAFDTFLQRLGRERRWETTWRALSGNSTTARQGVDQMRFPGMRSIFEEMMDPGPAVDRGAELAGGILMRPPTAAGAPPPIGMPGPRNIFLDILRMGENPMARGAVAGAGATRTQQ